MLEMLEDTTVITELVDPIAGLGNDIENPSLWEKLGRSEYTNEELLKSIERDGGVVERVVAPNVVVETMGRVVGPPERVPMGVVTTFNVLGSVGATIVPRGDKLMAVVEVLVSVIKILLVRIRLGKAPGGDPPKIVVETLVNIDVTPPDRIRVRVIEMREVTNWAVVLEVPGRNPPIVVMVALVKVIVLDEGVREGRETPGVEASVSHIEVMLDVGDVGSAEITGVKSGVFVIRVLKWFGGATPFIHSVVPFTTEKKYVPRDGFDGEGLISETVMMGPGTVT
jgi:hypothetical protein